MASSHLCPRALQLHRLELQPRHVQSMLPESELRRVRSRRTLQSRLKSLLRICADGGGMLLCIRQSACKLFGVESLRSFQPPRLALSSIYKSLFARHLRLLKHSLAALECGYHL